MPSSANDSRASSYQSPALDLAGDDGEGDDPKRIRSYPNASSAGPTSRHTRSVNLPVIMKRPCYLLYILIRFFHSFLSKVSTVADSPSGAPGVGEPHTGGMNLMN